MAGEYANPIRVAALNTVERWSEDVSDVDNVPRGDRWIHEIRFDGYRVQTHLANVPLSRCTSVTALTADID